jgi:hypothetical protein
VACAKEDVLIACLKVESGQKNAEGGQGGGNGGLGFGMGMDWENEQDYKTHQQLGEAGARNYHTAQPVQVLPGPVFPPRSSGLAATQSFPFHGERQDGVRVLGGQCLVIPAGLPDTGFRAGPLRAELRLVVVEI